MNTSIQTYALRSPLLDWGAQFRPRESVKTPVLPPKLTPTRFLSQIELATLRCICIPTDELPKELSILGDAAVRLKIFDMRGLLEHFSGDYIARCLQDLFFPHAHAWRSRRPNYGLDMLRLVDEHSDLTHVEVWLSAEPTDDDPIHFRRMRLSERITELVNA